MKMLTARDWTTEITTQDEWTDVRSIGRFRQCARPLSADGDLAPVLDSIGDARVVVLGDSTRGTQEFCQFRIELTKRLIEEKGFSVVAWDADATSALRTQRYLAGLGSDRSASDALADFDHFPNWSLQNQYVEEFVEWLRAHNARSDRVVDLFGLDAFDLRASEQMAVERFTRLDPALGLNVRESHGRFDSFGADFHRSESHPNFGYLATCHRIVLDHLIEAHAARAVRWKELAPASIYRVLARSAARTPSLLHYDEFLRSGVSFWNHRERQLAGTLDDIRETHAKNVKIVVWLHSAQAGDARATESGDDGRVSFGQIMRQKYPEETFLLGLTTSEGSLSTAADWGEPARQRRLSPAAAQTLESLLSRTGIPRLLLRSEDVHDHPSLFQRQIGAVYRPQTESVSHYARARFSEQFDAVVHLDRTHSLDASATLRSKLGPRLPAARRVELPDLLARP